MVQPDQLEAFYAAHPSVPKPIVRKIYEWKVSRDPDIFPLYYDRSRSLHLDIRTFPAPGTTTVASASPPLTSNPCSLVGSTMMPVVRKHEPIILTVRNRQARPV